MKTIITALFLVLGVASAEAKSLKCTDVNAGPDHGYILNFTKGNQYVKVSEDTIAGPQYVTTLKCNKNFVPMIASNDPDLNFAIYSCYETSGIADAGFSLNVNAYPNAKKTTATLNQISIAGEVPAADFNCK